MDVNDSGTVKLGEVCTRILSHETAYKFNQVQINFTCDYFFFYLQAWTMLQSNAMCNASFSDLLNTVNKSGNILMSHLSHICSFQFVGKEW